MGTGARGQLGAAAALTPTPGPALGSPGCRDPHGPLGWLPRHDVSAFVIKVPFVKPDVDSESQTLTGVHSHAAPSIGEEQAYVVSLEIS